MCSMLQTCRSYKLCCKELVNRLAKVSQKYRARLCVKIRLLSTSPVLYKKKKGSALCLPIICLADSQRKSWLGLKRQQEKPKKSKSERHEQANAQTEPETTSVLTCPCSLRCQTNLESNHYHHRNWLQCACGILSLSDCDVNWIKV